jgi:hypothetical protein
MACAARVEHFGDTLHRRGVSPEPDPCIHRKARAVGERRIERGEAFGPH